MATFAIVAALAILVALPAGIVLAQQQSLLPAPTNLQSDVGDGDEAYTAIVLTWDAPKARAVPSDETAPSVEGYRVDVSKDGLVWDMLYDGTNVGDVTIQGRDSGTEGDTFNTLVPGQDDKVKFSHTIGTAGTDRHYRVFAKYADQPSLSHYVGPISETTEAPQQSPAPTGLTASVPEAPPTRDDDGKIMLGWDSVADYTADGTGLMTRPGTTVLGYLVRVRENAETGWQNVDTEPAIKGSTTRFITKGVDTETDTARPTYVHEDLPDGVTLHYQVYAITQYGNSGRSLPSNVARGMTNPAADAPDGLKPGMPRGLVAQGGNGMITLVWNAPVYASGEDQGMIQPVVGYMVEYSETYHHATDAVKTTLDNNATGRDWTVLIANTGSSTTMYVDDRNSPANFGQSLAAGLTREYRVTAIGDGGAGADESDMARAKTTGAVSATDRLNSPKLFRDVATEPQETQMDNDDQNDDDDITKDSINVQWTVATRDSTSDPELATYRIWRAPTKAGPWTILVQSTEAAEAAPKTPTTVERAYLDKDLTAGTQYCYQVAGVDENGTVGLRSDEVCYDTDDAEVPGPPTAVKATPVTADRIDLTWTAPNDPDGASVTGYEIEYSTDDGTRWNRLTANTESDGNSATTTVEASYTDSTVQPEQTRLYRVYAINAAGRSLASSIAAGDDRTNATATTVAGEATRTDPDDIVATVSGTTVTVMWTDGAGADAHAVGLVNTADYSVIEADVANGVESHPFSNVPPGTYRPAVLALPGLDYLAFGPDSVTIPAGN
jgi:hypothetical protein